MINVIVNADSKYPVNKLVLEGTVLDLLKKHHISGNIEIGITIVGDRQMHEINKQFRGLDKPTNILTFALEDPVTQSQLQHIPKLGFVKAPDNIVRLGDIVISYEQASQDASLAGVAVEDEVKYLVEHGTKHLLGIHSH